MNDLIAPKSGSYQDARWEGELKIKPWEFPVQLVIPSLGSVEALKAAIPLWRMQTLRPYICIVDTGSDFETLEEIESLRADDVEIHYQRGHGYRHASEPVSVALDFASARCQQTYQFHSHCDVFPVARDLIERFVAACGEDEPVVGYEISGRNHCKGAMSLLWPGMVGHTATCLHYPTIRRLGITWSLDRGYAEYDLNRAEKTDTDTEVPFNLHLRKAGIKPLLLGHDQNYIRDKDNGDFDHCRSHKSSELYSPGYFETAQGWIESGIDDAQQRAKDWHNASICSTQPTG
jgi:glycosyltransferase involved in cell wall biosynthesis